MINEAELKLKLKTGLSVNKSEHKDPFEVGKESKNVPGIGAYNVIKTEHKFNIEEKIEKFASSKDDKPGVGEYDIYDAKIKLKKKTGISTVRKTGR